MLTKIQMARPPTADGSAPRRSARRAPRRRAATATVLLAVALTAGPATGAASAAVTAKPHFGAAQRIVDSQPNVPTAVDAAGQALTLRPGSGPGPALQLATARGPVRTLQLHSDVAGYNHPSVAIGDSGRLVATWDTESNDGSTPTVLEMAVGSFSSPPTSATPLAPATATVSGEQAYVTPAGTTIVLWDESDGAAPPTVRAAIAPTGAATPSPATLDANSSLVGAGLDAGGQLIVIERGPTGFVQRTIAADGTIGAEQDFTPPGAVAAAAAIDGELSVLVDGAGDQLYSWLPLGSHKQLRAVWRSSAGSFGAAQYLGYTPTGAEDGPVVALNASGHAVAVLAAAATGPLTVRFASRLGRFATVRHVGTTGRYADMPVVSINGVGRALVTWLDSPRSSRGTSHSRELVAEAHGTHFTQPARLPVQAGLGPQYLGDAPRPAAAANGAPQLVTYGAAKGSRSIGQLTFLRG